MKVTDILDPKEPVDYMAPKLVFRIWTNQPRTTRLKATLIAAAKSVVTSPLIDTTTVKDERHILYLRVALSPNMRDIKSVVDAIPAALAKHVTAKISTTIWVYKDLTFPIDSPVPVELKNLRGTDRNSLVRYLSTVSIIIYGTFLKGFPMLWLLKVKNLERVTMNFSTMIGVMQIINKHLTSQKDILDCQEELIDAGLEEYAEL